VGGELGPVECFQFAPPPSWNIFFAFYGIFFAAKKEHKKTTH
jgi:hypothetical protein